MAKIDRYASIEMRLTLDISESEARALDALTGYNIEVFIKFFYKSMGEHYMKPHEKGLRSLFTSVRESIPSHLSRADAARRVFEGRSKENRKVD